MTTAPTALPGLGQRPEAKNPASPCPHRHPQEYVCTPSLGRFPAANVCAGEKDLAHSFSSTPDCRPATQRGKLRNKFQCGRTWRTCYALRLDPTCPWSPSCETYRLGEQSLKILSVVFAHEARSALPPLHPLFGGPGY